MRHLLPGAWPNAQTPSGPNATRIACVYQVPVLLAVSAYNQGMVQARGGPAAAGEHYGLVPFGVIYCSVV